MQSCTVSEYTSCQLTNVIVISMSYMVSATVQGSQLALKLKLYLYFPVFMYVFTYFALISSFDAVLELTQV